MTALDELAREVGTSGRTLRRAADRGLIRARRPTPKKVEIGYPEREYVRTHWQTISKLLNALRTEPNVRAAALYGSFARGTDVPGSSDVDLLVVLRDESPSARWELQERLASRIGRNVDVVGANQAGRDPEFLLTALADARPVIDRTGEFDRLRRSTAELRRAAERRGGERKKSIAQNLARLGS